MEQYWPIVLAALPILAKILNRLTPKWSDVANAAARIMLRIIEVLDLLRSPSAWSKSVANKSAREEAIRKAVKEFKDEPL